MAIHSIAKSCLHFVFSDQRVRYFLAAGTLSATLLACGQEDQVKTQWVTIDNTAAAAIRSSFPETAKLVSHQGDTTVLEIDPDGAGEISEFMHEKFHRCGGYFAFDNERDATDFSAEQSLALAPTNIAYTIDQADVVNPLIEKIDPSRIVSMITSMSNFHNRFYTSATGSDSQAWVKAQWEQIGAGRSDFSVETVTHSNWPQPSIIATIQGSEIPDEIVVVGGHGDSIAGQFGRDTARAPGADDNASGISSLTETMRVLVDSGWRPKRTIKFMSYAAEEVGLKGSKEVARAFAADGKQVIGAMQLDMTAFNGANKIGLMRDHTNDSLSEFTINLIDHYVGVGWINDRCGYACSDHASWTAAGYPSVMPFESTYDDSNQKIHTAQDVLENSDATGAHSAKFAKLALAYLVEVAK